MRSLLQASSCGGGPGHHVPARATSEQSLACRRGAPDGVAGGAGAGDANGIHQHTGAGQPVPPRGFSPLTASSVYSRVANKGGAWLRLRRGPWPRGSTQRQPALLSALRERCGAAQGCVCVRRMGLASQRARWMVPRTKIVSCCEYVPCLTPIIQQGRSAAPRLFRSCNGSRVCVCVWPIPKAVLACSRAAVCFCLVVLVLGRTVLRAVPASQPQCTMLRCGISQGVWLASPFLCLFVVHTFLCAGAMYGASGARQEGGFGCPKGILPLGTFRRCVCVPLTV